jgi:hypothetical protein
VRSITLPENAQPVWHLIADQVIDFGRIPAARDAAVLIGSIHTSKGIWGQFRAAIPVYPGQGIKAIPFIYNTAGRITGRISLEQRQVTPGDLAREAHLSTQWKQHHALSMANSLGQQLGYRLLAQLA